MEKQNTDTGKSYKNPADLVIRMYWQHDLDLVTLCYYKDFSISYWMKQALIAYVRKDETFRIPVPEEQPIMIEHKNRYAHFKLNPKTEADVIDFVRSFRYGFCNNGVKQIMRSYLSEHFLNVYMRTSSYSMKPVEKKSKQVIFRKKEHYDHTGTAFPT